MKKQLVCKICNKDIGLYHGYQVPKEMHNHIKSNHPTEYKELSDIRNTMNILLSRSKKYGVGSSFIQYYK